MILRVIQYVSMAGKLYINFEHILGCMHAFYVALVVSDSLQRYALLFSLDSALGKCQFVADKEELMMEA